MFFGSVGTLSRWIPRNYGTLSSSLLESGSLRNFARKLADETGSISFSRAGRAPEFEGGHVSEEGALDAAARWLGKGYTEVSPGRFLSADGARQVRYGSHEVSGSVHHIHFEAYSHGRVVENTRAIIDS
jgi:hypothetical protein